MSLIKSDCFDRYLFFFFAIHRLAVIAAAFLNNLPPPSLPQIVPFIIDSPATISALSDPEHIYAVGPASQVALANRESYG